MKQLEKKQAGNYTSMLWAVLNISWKLYCSCTSTYLPSLKSLKKDEYDMLEK